MAKTVTQRDTFTALPSEVFYSQEWDLLSAQEGNVILRLYHSASWKDGQTVRRGEVNVSIREIARRTGCSDGTVARAIKKARDFGWIESIISPSVAMHERCTTQRVGNAHSARIKLTHYRTLGNTEERQSRARNAPTVEQAIPSYKEQKTEVDQKTEENKGRDDLKKHTPSGEPLIPKSLTDALFSEFERFRKVKPFPSGKDWKHLKLLVAAKHPPETILARWRIGLQMRYPRCDSFFDLHQRWDSYTPAAHSANGANTHVPSEPQKKRKLIGTDAQGNLLFA
jgi:DNA-binding MarR family transcriptional regulator